MPALRGREWLRDPRRLPPNEPGSPIMPGKVNLMQQEVMVMVRLEVIGDDSIVVASTAQGDFELNVMRPIVISNVLRSVQVLSDACGKLRRFGVKGTPLREAAVALGVTAANFDRVVDPRAMVGHPRRDLGLDGDT
jgi:fumarate hydratase class II